MSARGASFLPNAARQRTTRRLEKLHSNGGPLGAASGPRRTLDDEFANTKAVRNILGAILK